jgi:protein TonB
MDNSKKGKKKKIVEKPHYPGGPKALKEFIGKNLKYPKEAFDNRVEGSVYCRYKINHLGEVVDVFIITGLGYGCEEEAARIIKKLKFDLPKIPHRVKAYFQKTIRIHFKLKNVVKEKAAPARQIINYQYNLVNKPQLISNPKKKSPISYSFTIDIK